MAFNHDWLVYPTEDPVGLMNAILGDGTIWINKQPVVAVFSVATVCEVLALHDLFQCCPQHLPVVHSCWVAHHYVLLQKWAV
jgi:hypothetical protein